MCEKLTNPKCYPPRVTVTGVKRRGAVVVVSVPEVWCDV